MATFSRTTQSTRTGARKAVVVEGADIVAASFTRQAAVIGPQAAAVVMDSIREAADQMRSTVPVDEGDLLDSITVDAAPTIAGGRIYADAGPDATENPAAFKARFHEYGTVKMAPNPFVGPAGDRVEPGFVAAMKALTSW